MPLHLLKLCVGCRNRESLAAFQKARLEATGMNAHVTRQTPRRAQEILDGGSLYWVIDGMISLRQRITDIEPFLDADGVRRCRLHLEPRLVAVVPRAQRPFQGWRYLRAEDAPPDLDDAAAEEMPEELRRQLAELGLL